MQGKGKAYRKMKYLAESEFAFCQVFLISKIHTIHLKVGFNSVFGFPYNQMDEEVYKKAESLMDKVIEEYQNLK